MVRIKLWLVALGLIVFWCATPSCSTAETDKPDAAGRPASAPEFQVSDIEVEFTDGATHLAGSLFMPETGDPAPAVVLLGGSDRGARGPWKNRLARQFASGGIAVLTYDSPGTGRSGGRALFQSRLDRSHEANAAARYLRSRDDIDGERVGLLGGSEGARIALLSAGLDPTCAFAIAFSGGFGLSMMDLSRYRIEAMGLRRGLDDEDIRKAHVLEELLYALMSGHDVVEWRLVELQTARWENEPWGELIDLVRNSRDDLTAEAKDTMWSAFKRILKGWMAEAWFDIAVVDKGNLERVFAMDAPMFFALLQQGPLAGGDWYQSREELDLLAKVSCPVLAVWGEEDDYLPPHLSAAWLRSNLDDFGNRNVTLHIFPEANHSIVIDATGGYAPGFPDTLVTWSQKVIGETESR